MLMLQLLGWMLATLGALPLAYVVSTQLYRHDTDSERSPGQVFLTTALLWMLLQAAVVEGLLMAHAFALQPLLILEGLAATLGIVFLRRVLASNRPIVVPQHNMSLPVCLLLALGLVLLYLLATRPLTDFDSLAYHLPTLEGWLRSGYHAAPPGFESDQVGAYPYAWEAVCAPSQLIGRSTFLLLLPNLLAWTVLGVAVSLLGRAHGASAPASQLAALLLMCQPLCIEQVGTLHVDLPFAALLVAGVYYAQRWARQGAAADVVMTWVCAALLCAVKMSGLPYAAMLLSLGVGLRWWLGSSLWVTQQRTLKSSMDLFVQLGVSVVAGGVGAMFYLLNWVRLGNPLGYVPVRLGSWVLFAGRAEFLQWVEQTTLWHLFHFRDLHHLLILGKVSAFYLGLPFVALLLLATVAQRQSLRLVWAHLLWIACAVLYFRTPYGGDNGSHGWQITTWIGQGLRFALPALGILASVAARGADSVLRIRPLRRALALTPVLLAIARTITSEQLQQLGIKLDTTMGIKTLLIGELAAVGLAAVVVGVLERVLPRHLSAGQ